MKKGNIGILAKMASNNSNLGLTKVKNFESKIDFLKKIYLGYKSNMFDLYLIMNYGKKFY